MEVQAHRQGRGRLPASRQDHGRAVDSVLEGCNEIADASSSDRSLAISVETTKEFNRIVLNELEWEDGVIPGEIPSHDVVVGKVYRSAPKADCEFLPARLLERLILMEDSGTPSVSAHLLSPPYNITRDRTEFDLTAPLTKASVVDISGRVALSYADMSEKTLSRDVQFLLDRELLVQEESSLRVRLEVMQAFMPQRKEC